MSKARLKKELITFTREELVEVILAAYDSSKEAKEYFEFFLNPDADAFLEKRAEEIGKEINRTRRGRISKFRISYIRNIIKGTEAYGITPDYIMKLMSGTIRMLVDQFRYVYYSETQTNGVARLAADYIIYANSHDMLTQAVEDIESLSRSSLGTADMRELVAQSARTAVRSFGL